MDRYDDRDVIITNLYETYDRLMSFGAKHLSDPFVSEGIHSVSARDAIFREIFSNILAHRDFSSGYVAKFVIEKDKMFTENASRSQRAGILDLQTFTPIAKNPAISRVFRETTFADELGSGMRNTYKYTKLYSNQYPQFIEGDIFKTVIPLTQTLIGRIGPQAELTTQDKTQDRTQVETQDEFLTTQDRILAYCITPRSKAEVVSHCGYKANKSFTKLYLKPLIETGLLLMTIPDKPTSRNQKYITAGQYECL